MIALDVNVLLALFREDHVHHQTASSWWRGQLERATPITVPDLVWVGFVRIATSRRIFEDAAPLDAALAFLSAVCAQPTYARFVPHPYLLDAFALACTEGQVSGSLVTDAYLAATARTLGATLATFDRDFRRFDGLDVVELG